MSTTHNRADMLRKIRQGIEQCGGSGDFHNAVEELLRLLGYRSTRRLPGLTGGVEEFCGTVLPLRGYNANSNSEKQLKGDAKSVNVLFQFSEHEIPEEQRTFETTEKRFNAEDESSFFFIAVTLTKHLPRSRYAQHTREINKRFAAPVIVFFRTMREAQMTIAFADRRAHKLDAGRAVLERVSLIHEIRCDAPHRAHIDIVAELALDSRLAWIQTNNEKHNFAGLRRAWLAVLDTEAINKKFYRELLEWYGYALGKAHFPDNSNGDAEVRAAQQKEDIIRMISRLLFCWFLKERGLVAPELFREEDVDAVLSDYDSEGDSYYRAVLQNLFFATLNTKIERRGFSTRAQTTHRDFSRRRYHDLIADAGRLVGWLDTTPFVNGGLFDCLDDFDGVRKGGKRIDCFTDNPTHRKGLSVPNALFFGDKGIYKLFNRYKFTIEESTPIEQEVALDPELLGKVFENLLGYANEMRKESGSYYTPRPIVEYMVREAIIAHIAQRMKTQDGNDESLRKHLRYLFDYADAYDDAKKPFSETERKRIVGIIQTMRLLDPAVGSGAFPMGALQQLVLVLERLDPTNEFVRAREIMHAKRHTDPAAREAAIEAVERIFSADNDYNNYGRKLAIIRDTIFGVDIQPTAIQIAKLRFFISLVIEQDTNDNKEDNYGIRPLPNLESKFVIADNLFDPFRTSKTEKQDELIDSAIASIIDDIGAELERHFTAATRDEKKDILDNITGHRNRLREKLADTLGSKENANRIADWDFANQTTVCDWFDPRWMFGVRGGFDVVIGNPPYVQLQKDGGRLANMYRGQGYKTFAREGDIYCLFYERGVQLLAQHGHLCLITSNKWMRAGYGKNMRTFFVKCNPLLLIDLGPDIFEATVDTNIVLMQNCDNQHRLHGLTLNKPKEYPTVADITAQAQKSIAVDISTLGDSSWFIGSESEVVLKRKIEDVGTPLKDWDVSIYRGVGTGYNDAFVIDKDTRQTILDDCRDTHERERTAEIIRPMLRGRDIKRYQAIWANRYLLFIPWHFPLHNKDITGASNRAERLFKQQYPAVYNHLLLHKDHLSKRNKDETGIRYEWYALQRCANTYLQEFEKEKIVYPETTQGANFFLDKNGKFYAEKTSFILTGKSLTYLTALLSSKLITYYYFTFSAGTRLSKSGYQYNKHAVEQIPIPKITPENAELAQEIARLAEDILTAKAADATADTSKAEAAVEQLVYRLYQLTPEEINIVERES